MNTTHVTISTKNMSLVNSLKNENIHILEMGDDKYMIVIPVVVESRLIDLIVDVACDTHADATVHSYYQDGSGLDVRSYTMVFKNGVCIE